MRKIISFLLATVMMGSFTAYAEEITVNDNLKEEKAIISAAQIDCLSKLDIIPSVSASETAYITREMQAVTLMKLLNIRSVDMAVEKGLIDTLDNGETDLEQYVRFGEVARGMITALGYKPIVESGSRGFNAYITLAEELKISRGLGLSADDYVTEQEFSLMILRLMETPMVEFNLADKTLSKGTDEYTILSEYHDIYSGEGIITSNHYTNLSGPTDLKEGTIVIDSKDEFMKGDTKAEYLVGYKVEYYYKYDEDMDEKTLLWVYADEEENGELYLESEDIVDYEISGYKYDTGNRVKDAVFDNDVAIIYNGVAVSKSSLTKEQMMPIVGEVTLLNTDSDSKYEVAIIMNYNVVTVGSVNTDKGIINFREENAESISLEEYKAYDLFDKEYKQLNITDIRNKMVVWMAESCDKTYVTMIFTTETLTGEITGKRVDDGRVILTIAGKEHFVKAVKDADSLKIGAYGTFSLGIDGSIADWVVNIGANKKFVYAVNAFEDSETERIMLRAFDGEMKTLSCIEKVKINGERFSNNETAIQELKTVVDGLMIIETTAEGEIKAIETPASKYDGSGRPYVVGSVPKQGEGEGTLFIRRHGNLLCNYFGLADDCAVFMVPSDRSDYDKYRLGGAELLGSAVTVYGVTGYKTSEEQSRCIAAVYDRTLNVGDSSASSRTTTAITEVSLGLNENDEAIYKVTGKAMYTNSNVTFTVKDEALMEKVREGNVVRVDTDTWGAATAVTVDYDYEKGTASVSTGGAYGDNYRVGQGKIIKKWDDGVYLDTAGIYSYIQNQWIPLGVCNMWTWEKTRNGMEIKQITAADIKIGDKLIYWQGYGGIDNILIIKN